MESKAADKSGEVDPVLLSLAAMDARIWRMAYSYAKDADEAADLAQEVRLRVLQKRHGFHGQSAAETWIFRVAANLCRDHARSRLRKREREVPLDHDIEARARDQDALLALREALATLGPRQRQLITLREFAGLGYREIAEVLGISLGAVESGLFDARRKLAERLEGAGGVGR